MRSESAIRVVAILLLLGAGGLRAREIPVYREYTRSVQFYDDHGPARAEADQGPDRMALQSMRESKAQEVYLGKETILDLGFESGQSVFSSDRRPMVMPAGSMSSSEDTRRNSRDSSSPNWLSKSLSLPTLGQASNNAAASSMSSGAPEPTGWGWLADEISGQAEGEIPLSEDMLSEEELNPILAQEAAMKGAADAYISSSSSSLSEVDRSDPMAAMGAFPDEQRAGMRSSDGSSYEPAPAASREWAGESRGESSQMKNYAAPSAMAEFSQTREIISEWSVGARPDFSSVATVGRRDTGSGMASGYSSQPMGGSSRGSWGGSSSAGLSSGGLSPVSGSSSWRGGWGASSAGAGRSSSFKTLSDPTPDPVVPSSSYERSKPSTSSGGYKPAWY